MKHTEAHEAVELRADRLLREIIDGEGPAQPLSLVFNLILNEADKGGSDSDAVPTMAALLIYTVYRSRGAVLDQSFTIGNLHFMRDHVTLRSAAADFLKKLVQSRLNPELYAYIRYINEGMLHYCVQELEQARKAFEQAGQLRPGHFVPPYFLTLIDLQQGDYDRAIRLYPAELYEETYSTLPRIFGSEQDDVSLDAHELLDAFLAQSAELTSVIAGQTVKYAPVRYDAAEAEMMLKRSEDKGPFTAEVYQAVRKFDEESAQALERDYPGSGPMQRIGSVVRFLLTGEWIWHNHRAVLERPEEYEGIDLTYMAASYFKAAELLLCKKIGMLSQGVELGKFIIHDEQYYQQSTMGNYCWFIQHYRRGSRQYAIYNASKDPVARPEDRFAFTSLCRSWTDQCRNALQHKGYIGDPEALRGIRTATLRLMAETMRVLR